MCRPFGPFGVGKVHNCSATFGASRFATAQAEGALKIKALCPEIRALLFEASSQAKTLGGKNGTAFLNHSSTVRIASLLIVISPLASTSCAPWLLNIEPTHCTASLVVLIGMPNGKPALKAFSAACENNSQFQAAVSSLSGGAPAGYILVTSSPTICFIRSMRAQGGESVLPNEVGTATQWPSCLPRYSAPALTAPCCRISSAMTSSKIGRA